MIEEPKFEEFWHRDVEESIRQGTTKPFKEEAVLQVSDWGFRLADLQVHKKCKRKGVLSWLKSLYSEAECELAGFLGPIHIWQVYFLLFSFFVSALILVNFFKTKYFDAFSITLWLKSIIIYCWLTFFIRTLRISSSQIIDMYVLCLGCPNSLWIYSEG